MKKTVIVLVILGLIGYSAFLVVEPHYNYYAFKTDLDEYLRVAINIPKRVRNEVYEMVQQYDIPVEKDEIIITRSQGTRYSVSMSWEVTVDFFTLYQKTFYFEIDTAEF